MLKSQTGFGVRSEFLLLFLFGWLGVGVNGLEGVCASGDIEQQPGKPELEGRPLNLFDFCELFDSRSVELRVRLFQGGLIHKSGHPNSDILHIPIVFRRQDTLGRLPKRWSGHRSPLG
jgi:hypothetical protein